MRMKGGSLAAPLCLQPLHLSCRHMVLKVKVSHQADEADVAGFHHVTNLLCHYRQSFSCFFIRLFVCFLMCLKSTSWWIPSLYPHASLHTLLPPSKPDIKHALLNFMKKDIHYLYLMVMRSRNSGTGLFFAVSWRWRRLQTWGSTDSRVNLPERPPPLSHCSTHFTAQLLALLHHIIPLLLHLPPPLQPPPSQRNQITTLSTVACY